MVCKLSFTRFFFIKKLPGYLSSQDPLLDRSYWACLAAYIHCHTEYRSKVNISGSFFLNLQGAEKEKKILRVILPRVITIRNLPERRRVLFSFFEILAFQTPIHTMPLD